ncbi:hypothetical protein QIW49_06100 [Francisellaceae bacterium CB300]
MKSYEQLSYEELVKIETLLEEIILYARWLLSCLVIKAQYIDILNNITKIVLVQTLYMS